MKQAAESLGIPARTEKGGAPWVLFMLQGGLYSLQLRHFYDHFDPSQILLVQVEEFFDRTPEVMQRVEKFLGVRPHDWHSYFERKKVFNLGDMKPHDSTIKYPPMKRQTRRALEEFFEPFNRDLYRMFRKEDPFPEWKYASRVKLRRENKK